MWRSETHSEIQKSQDMSKTQDLDRKRELALWCTYANDHGGLPVPFVEEVVDGVLDDGGIAPVVLGQDEDEGGVFLDLLAPGTAVRLGVVGVVGDLGGKRIRSYYFESEHRSAK